MAGSSEATGTPNLPAKSEGQGNEFNQQSAAEVLVTPDLGNDAIYFKIDLEFVLAFHVSLLPECSLKKDIPYTVRNGPVFNNARHLNPSRAYRSWAVHSTENPEVYLPYTDQPLRIAQEAAIKSGIFVDVIADIERNGVMTTVSNQKWYITKEHSVRGVCSTELVKRLEDRVTIENVNDWDSYGIKAVSRVFTNSSISDGPHIDEIGRVLQTLVEPVESAALYGTFNTSQTGFHVHVQAPESLDVLKQLAFILLVYEDQISRLVPPCRQVGHISVHGILKSNRADLLDLAPKDGKNGWSFNMLYPLDGLTSLIESCQTETDLLWLVGRENNRLVSFFNLQHGQRDIVFRQHQGTLDITSIRWWTFTTVGLVRLAYYYARCKPYPVKNWSAPINIFDLLFEMNMPKEGRTYFANLSGFYHYYPTNGILNASDIEMPPDEGVPAGKSTTYEVGVIANEAMGRTRDGIFKPANYHISNWIIIRNPSTGPTGHESMIRMCGIWALLISLQYQYPKHPAVSLLDFDKVLAAVKEPHNPHDYRPTKLITNYSDEQLSLGLETLGTFKLVVVSSRGAERVSFDPEMSGNNVYIHSNATVPPQHLSIDPSHWSAMKKICEEMAEMPEHSKTRRGFGGLIGEVDAILDTNRMAWEWLDKIEECGSDPNGVDTDEGESLSLDGASVVSKEDSDSDLEAKEYWTDRAEMETQFGLE